MKFLTTLFLLFTLSRGINGYDTVCYDGLGCFTDAPPWGDTEERPVGYLPQDPSKVKTRFYLDTRAQHDVEVFNTDMIDLSYTTFDSKKPVKFIVHGFIQNGDTTWMITLSDTILSVDDVNVIRVGWFGGSATINYALSATDTQVVGAEIALFINNIKSYYGKSSTDFHCIGHSLGAQACSYIGAKVYPPIARISGLDPAGPYFENTPYEVRLDSSDAEFVDVVHTDAEKLINFGFGINQVSGHIDFWPNDGIAQPGCDQNILTTILDPDGIWEGTQNFVACNHLRAIDLYVESINSPCPFGGNPCDSYENYQNGKCLICDSTPCPSMGYYADSYKNEYINNPNHYLQTGPTSPFCEYMTYVKVKLGANSDGVEGTLALSLYGSTDNSEQQQLSDEGQVLDLRPSTTYSYVTEYEDFPSGLNKVKLLWTQTEFTIYNQYLRVDVIEVWDDFGQQWYSFYGDPDQKLEPDTRYSFYLQ